MELTSNAQESVYEEVRPRQLITLSILIMLAAVVFIALCYRDDARGYDNVDFANTPIAENVVYDIGDVIISEDVAFVQGYAIKEGEPIDYWDVRVVLLDEASGEWLAVPTIASKTPNALYLFPGADKTTSRRVQRAGFEARIPEKKLDLSNHSYHVYLYFDHNHADEMVDTGMTLRQDGLH